MADTQETREIRRIVTGHNAAGKSVVVSDDRVMEVAAGNFNHWVFSSSQAGGKVSDPGGNQAFYPQSGQTFFRFFRLPPVEPGVSSSDLEAFAADLFGGFGITHCRVDTSRHPMMHRTPTTDFIVLLKGNIALLLDEGEPVELEPFDVVVQQATNHAWVNTGDGEALLVAVMNGNA